MTKTNKEKLSALRILIDIEISAFKKKYPNLNVNSLEPKYPSNIDIKSLEGKDMGKINLHPVTLSVLCGTVFGDSNLAIPSGYKNARVQYNHSTRQTEWFMWKSLCPFGSLIYETGIGFRLPDGKQQESSIPNELLGKWHVASCANPELTKLHSEIAPKNVKTIKRYWLNHMNDYFLMTLWLDDGSLYNGRQGILCLNSMPVDQAEILAKYIKNVWKVECTVQDVPSRATKTNPNPIQIAIDDLDALENLFRIIAPIIPVESMLYKVCIVSIDRSRQQRWASELKTLVREEWHDTIDKQINYRIAKSS